MTNPDYATLLAQIAATSDPIRKAALIAECYVFNETPTAEEITLFEYVAEGYIEDNPGDIDDVYSSYVGVYINQDEEYTGIRP